jgi:sugar/nucleoside kinase (ribokinase family)
MDKTHQAALKLLKNAEERLASLRGLVGLDGYVDQILRVVDKRQSDGTVTHITTIKDFGARIQNAAGKSTKFELSVQQTKLGGNGVIMANALARLGLPLTYVGDLGLPEIHPVFRPMQSICEVISLGEACYTDAFEFHDGKIMLSRQEATDLVSWKTLMQVVGPKRLFELFEGARLVALNNWASLAHMTDIWQHVQKEICPRLSKTDRFLFIDLADPQFRLAAQTREALETIGRFAKWFHTTLGLNQREASEILEVLGLQVKGTGRDHVRENAEVIRSALDIQGVVVHPTAYAAAASRDGSVLVEGPYVENPLISTGAGDHFNAGYALGSVLGGDLKQCLQVAVAASGYYVRTARSPSLAELRKFLEEIV